MMLPSVILHACCWLFGIATMFWLMAMPGAKHHWGLQFQQAMVFFEAGVEPVMIIYCLGHPLICFGQNSGLRHAVTNAFPCLKNKIGSAPVQQGAAYMPRGSDNIDHFAVLHNMWQVSTV